MMIKRSLLGGLAGAAVLNLVHEIIRKFVADAPHIQLLGEQALSKTMKKIDVEPPSGKSLYFSTLAGDLISNSLYFSLIGSSKKANLLGNGLGYGAVAGLGAVLLSKPLGLDDKPVNRTPKTTSMTIGYYILGGIVAAAVISRLKNSR